LSEFVLLFNIFTFSFLFFFIFHSLFYLMNTIPLFDGPLLLVVYSFPFTKDIVG
jgi:hypothetical protein